MNRFLHIDSRNRTTSSTPSRAEFNLPEPVRGLKQFRVKYVQFTNQLHNVTADSNTLTLASAAGQAIITPGFYSASDLVAAIHTQLPGLVSLNGSTGLLSWTLGPNKIRMEATTIYRQLGLDPSRNTRGSPYGGSFTSQIQLSFPMSVCLVSPELIGPERQRVVYAGKQQATLQSFVNFPVTAGNGEVETYRPETESGLMLDKSGSYSISKINIGWYDPSTEREVAELNEWVVLLELI
jgi:hypothetical protein